MRRFNDLRRDVDIDDGTARDLMIGALTTKTLQQLEGILQSRCEAFRIVPGQGKVSYAEFVATLSCEDIEVALKQESILRDYKEKG